MKLNNRRSRFAEKQVTKKGSKVDIVNLDGEELKKSLEDKLGIELNWGDYSWEAKGDFNGIEVYLNFTESDNGNAYEIGYRKDGSIHDRSVWEGKSIEEFEKDSDGLLAELGDYGDVGGSTDDFGGDEEDDYSDEDDSEIDDSGIDDTDDEGATEDFDDYEADESADESAEEEVPDFEDFGESRKAYRANKLQDSLSRANKRAALREKFNRLKAKKKQESETLGHFELLQDYFNNTMVAEESPLLRPVFTDNGAYDLEKAGLSGYYVWVGYRHSARGASEARKNKMLKEFVYNSVLPLFEEFVDGSGEGNVEDIVVEDKLATTDMFRLYVVTGKKIAESVRIKYPVLKQFEECTLRELFNKVGLKEEARSYLGFDRSIKNLDYMLDECNQDKLVNFLKTKGVRLTH